MLIWRFLLSVGEFLLLRYLALWSLFPPREREVVSSADAGRAGADLLVLMVFPLSVTSL